MKVSFLELIKICAIIFGCTPYCLVVDFPEIHTQHPADEAQVPKQLSRGGVVTQWRMSFFDTHACTLPPIPVTVRLILGQVLVTRFSLDNWQRVELTFFFCVLGRCGCVIHGCVTDLLYRSTSKAKVGMDLVILESKSLLRMLRLSTFFTWFRNSCFELESFFFCSLF